MNTHPDAKAVFDAARVVIPHAGAGPSSWITLGAIAVVLGTAAPRVQANDLASADPSVQSPVETSAALPPSAPQLIRELAASKPNAALAVLSILHPGLAPLAGSTTGNFIRLYGIPTAQTAELLLARADSPSIAASLREIPVGAESFVDAFLQIRWEMSARPNGNLLVRVNAEIVERGGCGLETYEPVESETLVEFRRNDTGLLSWVAAAAP